MIGKLPFGNLCGLYGLRNLAACEALPQAEPTGNALAVSVHYLMRMIVSWFNRK